MGILASYERRMTVLHRFPITLDSYDYRSVCLFSACVVYALFGSPTPNQLSVIEIVIGILLCLSIGIGRVRDAVIDGGMTEGMRPRFWKSAGHVFLLYGLSIPVIVGVILGNDFSVMVRDIVPFLFLFLPLFMNAGFGQLQHQCRI